MADRLTARRALATGTATVVLLVGCGSTPDAEQQTALRDHNDGQAPGGDSIAPTDPGGRIDGSVDAGSTGAEQKVPAPPDASSGEVAPAEPTEGDPALWPPESAIRAATPSPPRGGGASSCSTGCWPTIPSGSIRWSTA